MTNGQHLAFEGIVEAFGMQKYILNNCQSLQIPSLTDIAAELKVDISPNHSGRPFFKMDTTGIIFCEKDDVRDCIARGIPQFQTPVQQFAETINTPISLITLDPDQLQKTEQAVFSGILTLQFDKVNNCTNVVPVSTGDRSQYNVLLKTL